MDTVFIRGLRLQTVVGVGDEERARPQEVTVDVEVHTDLSTAASTDQLEDTVDYHSLLDRVSGIVQASESRLLEDLAGKIVAEISTLRGARAVTVEIAKVSPPIEQDVDTVGVRLERKVS